MQRERTFLGERGRDDAILLPRLPNRRWKGGGSRRGGEGKRLFNFPTYISIRKSLYGSGGEGEKLWIRGKKGGHLHRKLLSDSSIASSRKEKKRGKRGVQGGKKGKRLFRPPPLFLFISFSRGGKKGGLKEKNAAHEIGPGREGGGGGGTIGGKKDLVPYVHHPSPYSLGEKRGKEGLAKREERVAQNALIFFSHITEKEKREKDGREKG